MNKWIRWDKRFKHRFTHNLRTSWDYQTGNLTGGQDDSYQLLIYSWLCLGACISNYNLSGLESQGGDEDHNKTRASLLKNISLSLKKEESMQYFIFTLFHDLFAFLSSSPCTHNSNTNSMVLQTMNEHTFSRIFWDITQKSSLIRSKVGCSLFHNGIMTK